MKWYHRCGYMGLIESYFVSNKYGVTIIGLKNFDTILVIYDFFVMQKHAPPSVCGGDQFKKYKALSHEHRPIYPISLVFEVICVCISTEKVDRDIDYFITLHVFPTLLYLHPLLSHSQVVRTAPKGHWGLPSHPLAHLNLILMVSFDHGSNH